MGIVAETFTFNLKKKLLERYSKANLTRAAERVREEIVRLMLLRILDGVDVNGKAFAGYTKQYKRLKGRFISGDLRKNRALQKLASGKTAYKANKVSDFMRFSGNLLSDIQSTVLSISGGGALSRSIKMQIRVFVGAKNQPKAEGLSRKRKWFGLSKSGSRQKLESKRITEIIMQELKK